MPLPKCGRLPRKATIDGEDSLNLEYGELLANDFSIWQRVWRARSYPGFRDKVTRMVIDFLHESSVLVGVLGILDSVIAWRQEPTFKVVGWSLGIALGLFSVAVIIQAINEAEPREASAEPMASNSGSEE